jgi:hypothetical protein
MSGAGAGTPTKGADASTAKLIELIKVCELDFKLQGRGCGWIG